MKQFALSCAILVLSVATAKAWNDKGHMVVARIAWNEMTSAERSKVVDILRSHPHYGEFLKDRRPDNVSEDEWVFMRAATWADWVRAGPAERKTYNRPEDHYVNLPIVRPGSKAAPPDKQGGKILDAIPAAVLEMKNGGDRTKRAVAATWIFHLVGDLHQPLHCVALYSDAFPKGDRGGNLSLFRIKTSRIQMHSYWDGLLGNEVSLSSIRSAVNEIEQKLKQSPDAVAADLNAHTTPLSWAKEGQDLAKRYAYRKPDPAGQVEFWPASAESNPDDAALPQAPDSYATDAGAIARLCIAKAGKRLAVVLREALGTN